MTTDGNDLCWKSRSRCFVYLSFYFVLATLCLFTYAVVFHMQVFFIFHW